MTRARLNLRSTGTSGPTLYPTLHLTAFDPYLLPSSMFDGTTSVMAMNTSVQLLTYYTLDYSCCVGQDSTIKRATTHIQPHSVLARFNFMLDPVIFVPQMPPFLPSSAPPFWRLHSTIRRTQYKDTLVPAKDVHFYLILWYVSKIIPTFRNINFT